MSEQKRRIEFGDFQTPDLLSRNVCERLKALGIQPEFVVEPTCGVGAFVVAAAETFPQARRILGYEVNGDYLATVATRLGRAALADKVTLEQADFFQTNWRSRFKGLDGSVLVLGNFPWVTSAALGVIGGANMPAKSNFQGHNGFDAISGKANFDISEWMLLEVLRWFEGRSGDIAMLVKTAVARKVLAYAERQRVGVREALLIGIDAKKEFNASVDACLLVIRMTADRMQASYDYRVYSDLSATVFKRVGHRDGLTVGDLDAYARTRSLVGISPQKWRSGVKHDASGVMEFRQTTDGLVNGLGEVVDLEPKYLYPLLKGSDVGSAKTWRGMFALVTQRFVGESTTGIRDEAPRTWAYLEKHAAQLDGRVSTIYAKNPRFSIFGVGDYAFRPWRIAICGLYKRLRFRLVGPMQGRPVMFDDTVYYVSFDTEAQAVAALERLEASECTTLLTSLIFWDEKRPIKTGILNVLDWSKVGGVEAAQASFA